MAPARNLIPRHCNAHSSPVFFPRTHYHLRHRDALMANNSSRPPLTSSAATSTEPWLQLCLSGAGDASSYPITSADTPRRSDPPTAALRPQCPLTPSSTVPAPSSPGADLRVGWEDAC
ncbi:hypothetical protein HPP92_006763 [Vanilla planifolia]|uniref:Uncharacterized protein n=1 Tax=Vanilla planifolia TaxID=51239 RepID=A0A835RKH9_VANPL|nr:hypothetical protein HPP92_006763 [Vanilla planifolia]